MIIMELLAFSTWICIALGFFVDPTFFLLGAIIFLIVAIWWTTLAVIQGDNWKNIFITWAVPLILFLAFGFAFMYLPDLPNERGTSEND